MVERRSANVPQKAELEDEARGEHELDEWEARHEIDGNEIYELDGRRSNYDMLERQSGRLLRV